MVTDMHTNVQMNHIQNSSFNRDLWGNRIITQFIPTANTSVCEPSFNPVCVALFGIIITTCGS